MSNRKLGALVGAFVVSIIAMCSDVKALEVVPFTYWTELSPGVWIQEQVVSGKIARLTYGRSDNVERFAVTTECGEKNRKTTIVWERGDLFGTSLSCEGKIVEQNPVHLELLFINLPSPSKKKAARPAIKDIEKTLKPRITT